MIYLVAIFIPPLYFLLKKKWLATIITMVVFVCSLAFLIVLPFTWFVCAVCAIWDLRKSLANEHAELIGKKVAENIRREQAAAGK